MNKYQEKALLYSFKNNYKDFPGLLEERIDNQDQPDSVIITTDNRKIGIELTEMYQDNHKSKAKGSELKKTEMVYEKIGNSIVDNVVQKSTKVFHLDITFHANAKFDKRTIQNIIKELSALIIIYLPTSEPRKPIIVSDFRILPDEVIDFCIINHPYLTKSYFGNSQSAVISDLTNSHIETVLRDKNNAFDNYENCDEQWLIIQIGHFIAGSFDKNRIDSTFKSKFDKVFIYDIQNSNTLQLSVEKYR